MSNSVKVRRGCTASYVKIQTLTKLNDYMLIPYKKLAAATLNGLIEDFVTRDGTDHGDNTPLEIRIERVQHALDKKQAVIVFDVETQQCQLCLRREVPREWLDDLEQLEQLELQEQAGDSN